MLTGPAQARELPDWSYERLFKEAEVVVIATADSMEETGTTTQENQWKVEFVEVSTTFSINAVLKGKPEAKRLKVIHHLLRPDVRVENGPLLVSFRLKPMKVKTAKGKESLGKPQYLLFLKKRNDGAFELLSGPIDPALSVRIMQQPAPVDPR
jgi:hypothetical protein